MTKAYIFLRKLVALSLNVLVFLIASKFAIPMYISIPVLVLAFGLIISRILGSSPKELFNYQRSEKYFARGGLRDLLRIPVMLFAFVHDLATWLVWGAYQIFIVFVDILFYIKELLFWILHAVIWFLKQLVPFWRVIVKMAFHYLIKWPWWIYRYAFYTIKKTYNWNILKISLLGTFISLFVFEVFYFLDVTIDGLSGMMYIGIVLALLPLSWLFGEISSVRAQELMFAPFKEVRKKFRNGLETVRAMLFFITFFVVLALAEAGLSALGLIPKWGIILMGFSLNINFLINLVLFFLGIVIVFGSFIVPTYRLYNEFNETSLKNVFELLKYILKRSLQYISGFIPSSIFATISSAPAIIVVALAFSATIWVKNSIINDKIETLSSYGQTENYQVQKEINHLQYVKQFPQQILQEMGHRALLKDELNSYKAKKSKLEAEYTKFRSNTLDEINSFKAIVKTEQQKDVINQTRIEELTSGITSKESLLKNTKTISDIKISDTEIDITFAEKKLKQLPWVFFFSGLLLVTALSFALSFFFAYFANFFFRTYLFRNDNTQANWKSFIATEKDLDKKQPLLSTTLNIFAIAAVVWLAFSLFATQNSFYH